MRMLPIRLAIVSLLLAAPGLSLAADSWIEVRSPHFTVVSNAGEKTARNIAWQFEQFRSAIETGWLWAHVKLSRPLVVIAAKDETTMRALAPSYWENRDQGFQRSADVGGRGLGDPRLLSRIDRSTG